MTHTDWYDPDDGEHWDDKTTRHRTERQHTRQLLNQWHTTDHDTAWD